MPLVGPERKRIKTEYQDAYRAANGYDAPSLWYERGWWNMKIGPYGFTQRIRTARLVEMTKALQRRASEAGLADIPADQLAIRQPPVGLQE